MYRFYHLVNRKTYQWKKVIIEDSVLGALGLLFFINIFLKEEFI